MYSIVRALSERRAFSTYKAKSENLTKIMPPTMKTQMKDQYLCLVANNELLDINNQ